MKGAVHNTFMTPDGRYVVAGSIEGKNATVIDTQTEQVAWVMDFDLGVRPMAFEPNADGSTRRMFVQLTEFNGFAVVDFATHKELTRIELPKLGPGKTPVLEGGNASHGLAVTCRRKEARGGQPSEQRRLRVLAARPQASGFGGRRQGA